MRKLCLSTALACLLPATLSAQQTKPPDVSKEAVVIEKISTRVDFENDGTLTRTLLFRARLQSEAGVKNLGLLRLQYDNSREILTARVRVIKPDGSVLEVPTNEIQDMTADISREAPMYTDVREKHVPVKGLSVGAILEYELKNQITTAYVPGEFWGQYVFNREDVVNDETFAVSFPKDRAVTVLSPDRKWEESFEGPRKVLTWHSSNGARPAKGTLRTINFPDVRVTTFKDWNGIAKWYASLQAGRDVPSPEITAKAQDLVKDATTDEEKVRRIYQFVSTRFRYISIDFGIGAFQPRSAGEVFRNG